MTFECGRLDDVLREGDALELAAARAHAQTCPGCRESLEGWDAISAAAPSLRQSWDSPELWPKIRKALAAEDARSLSRARLARFVPLTAIAATLLAAVAVWSLMHRPRLTPESPDAEQRLLTERALHAVEESEAQYVASIDRLAKAAEPLASRTETPLRAAYVEKLQVLDAAIADCRAQIERNRFNAQLRRELLSIYREKQRTLEEMMGDRT
jgi:hypothetical protein